MQSIDPFSDFKPRPERKRGRGARFGRGGGYFPTHLQRERQHERRQRTFDETVQQVLRDEQITSDNTLFRSDHHIAHFTEDSQFALLDTGASIPVIPVQVAIDLQLPLTSLIKPTRVRMANGAIELIHQVADLGPIIGFAGVLKSATQTLIGLGPLMDKGFEVHFAKSGVGIFLHNKLIYKGTYDSERKLFQINIMDLILPSSPPQYPQISDDLMVASIIPLRVSNDTSDEEDPAGKVGDKAPSRRKRKNEKQTETIDPVMIKEALWLHKRMGHPSCQVMMKSIAHNAWTGIPAGLTPAIIDSVFRHIECTACALGKRNRLPREKGTGIHPVQPGHTLSFDYQPVTTPSITGHTGYFLFKCLCSGYRHAILTKSKDSANLKQAITQVTGWYKKHGFPTRKLRFDSGSTEKGQELTQFLAELEIDYSPASVNSQFQNPVEREVQTVNKGVATLFADQHLLNSSFWTYALNHWILSANATPIAGHTSPVEQVTGRSVNISRMFRFPFGCPVTSTKEQAKVNFPNVKSEMGICLGAYAENDKSILLYIPGKRLKEFPRLNVQTLKVNFPPHPKTLDVEPVYDDMLQVQYKSPINRQTQLLGTHGFQHFGQVMDDMDDDEMFPSTPSTSSSTSTSALCPQYWFEQGGPPDPSSSASSSSPAPSSDTTSASVNWLSNQIETNFSISVRTADNPSMAQALRNWQRWSIPADKEMTMLADMDLYDEIAFDDVPPGAQILPTKMDFKTKYDSFGAFLKDKARLVVLDNLEWETLQDYFSPTAHTKTLNLLLALAVEHDFILYGLDIYGAFITADIDEPVYVSLPKGLPTRHGSGRIWRLKKTLYGLKRSPRAFFDSLSSHLLSKNYSRSSNDPCLFYKRTSATEVIVFCIHVDDFAIAASHAHLIRQLTLDLKDKGYIITESDSLETFLGIHIHSQRSGIYLSQPGHLEKIFECAQSSGKSVDTPMSAEFNDLAQDNSPLLSKSKDAPQDKSLEYFQHLLGMIMFVVRTRPDITYSVNRMDMRTSKTTEKDIKSLQRIAACL